MSASGRYKVALIGLGTRGYKAWFECLQHSSLVDISVVCDTNTTTIQSFASRHPDVPAFSSLKQLLEGHKPHFAILSVPNRFHSQCIAQLSAAGVPVLKEKPIAESVADFQQICQYRNKLGVVFQRRWQPRFLSLKRFLPLIGNSMSFRATLVGNYNPPDHSWRVADSVGTFHDLGIHILDIIVWLFGRPSTVLAYQVKENNLHLRDRESHVSMRWENTGLVGPLYVSEVGIQKEESLHIRGTMGSLHLHGNEISHHDASGKQIFHEKFQSHKEGIMEAICLDFGQYVSEISAPFSTSLVNIRDTLTTSMAVSASFASGRLETVCEITTPAVDTRGSNAGIAPSSPINCAEMKLAKQINGNASAYLDNGFINKTQQRFLLNTGDMIPGLGFGTRKPKVPRQTYNAVLTALQLGYRHIDTASRYNNEDQVGEAVRDSGIPRQAIWVTTKLDNSWHHRVAESAELSLSALGLDYIDLLLMHWPSPVSPDDPKKGLDDWDFIRTWQDMQLLVKSNRVRNIGVSNLGIRNLKKLLAHPTCLITPAVNQIELHPCCPSTNLLEFCKQRGIHCTAYSPLASGLPMLHQSHAINELCRRKGRTSQQILLMWGLQRSTSVIPKCVTPERIASNFDLAGWSLSPEEHATLSSLEERCRVYPDDWLPGRAFWDEDN